MGVENLAGTLYLDSNITQLATLSSAPCARVQSSHTWER
jgi:hypothetical protein